MGGMQQRVRLAGWAHCTTIAIVVIAAFCWASLRVLALGIPAENRRAIEVVAVACAGTRATDLAQMLSRDTGYSQKMAEVQAGLSPAAVRYWPYLHDSTALSESSPAGA